MNKEAKSIAILGAMCLACIMAALTTSNNFAALAFCASAVWFAYAFILELLIYIKND